MNAFIDKYLIRLGRINSHADVDDLYKWFWHNQKAYSRTIDTINEALELTGPFVLKKDLPCISVGGTRGVLLVSANPGWNKELNRKEDRHCRQSPTAYVNLMRRFFDQHPRVVHRKTTWWSRAISSVRLLEDWQDSFGDVKGVKRWSRADETELIGGWELFPFHSQKDSLCNTMDDHPRLETCAKESLWAALRLNPRILFVTSKQGARLVHELLPKHSAVHETKLGTGSSAVTLKYMKHSAQTEIITVSHQMFSAPRNFTNADLFSAVQRLRGAHKRASR